MIYSQLLGVKDNQGHVLLLCNDCKAAARDARALTILKVCSNCGIPLGEWLTEAERDTELEAFAAEVKRNT